MTAMEKPAIEPIVSPKALRRSSRTRRRLLAAGAVVAVLGAGVAVLVLVLTRSMRFPTVDAYTLETVRSGTMEENVTLEGTVNLAGSRIVAAPEPGVVEEVLVREGDAVRAGQVLMRISSESLDRDLQDADHALGKARREHDALLAERTLSAPAGQRSLERLRSAVSEAARDAERARDLAALGGASRDAVRSAEAREWAASADLADRGDALALDELHQRVRLAELQAEIGMLEERMARLAESRERCTVRGPAEGAVQKVGVVRGAYVNRYETLAVIADSSMPLILARLPDRYLASVRVGFPASVLVAGSTVAAHVKEIGAEVRAETSGYGSVLDIRVSLTDPPERLVEGMPAVVTLVMGRREGALIVRRGPFFGTNQERFVFRVRDGKAVRTEVRFGMVTETEVEILDGLREGDRIITSDYTEYVAQEEVTLGPAGGGIE
jgi:HlyD family secretion protein